MGSFWREEAIPIIEAVLKETSGQSEKEIRAALRYAYPFGQRKHHPYKIWLDEIKIQRGIKPRKNGGRTLSELKDRLAEIEVANNALEIDVIKNTICTVSVHHICGGEASFVLCGMPCFVCAKTEACKDHPKEKVDGEEEEEVVGDAGDGCVQSTASCHPDDVP